MSFGISGVSQMEGNGAKLYTFGGVRAINCEGKDVLFRTRKTGSLFAYLGTQLGKNVPRESLCAMFWPDAEEAFARNSLSVALTSLRRQLEETKGVSNQVLYSDNWAVRLNDDRVWCDAAEFHRLLRRARVAEPDSHRLDVLFGALDLYEGPFLLSDEEAWAELERFRFEQLYLETLCQVLDLVEEESAIHRSLSHATRALVWHPKKQDIVRRVSALRSSLGMSGPATYRKAKSAEAMKSDPRLLRDIQGFLEAPAGEVPPTIGEHLGGAVPLSSPYYLQRTEDTRLADCIQGNESVILIKGPRQIGKSSLLARGVAQARAQSDMVLIADFQAVDSDCLASTRMFYLWLIDLFLDQLGKSERAEAFWDDKLTPSMNIEKFIRGQLLAEGRSVFWFMDEADRLFGTAFRSDFFSLIRSWHNRRAMDPTGPWDRLTISITYATEAHLFIQDLNQSPFNVGVSLELQDFDLRQVAELNHRYGNPLKNLSDLQDLFALVGGHPYLVRVALHALSKQASVDGLSRDATDDKSPFGPHLRGLLLHLESSPEVCADLANFLRSKEPLNQGAFYRLRSAGVVRGSSNSVAEMRCGLYNRYFTEKLANA